MLQLRVLPSFHTTRPVGSAEGNGPDGIAIHVRRPLSSNCHRRLLSHHTQPRLVTLRRIVK
jgi:hypothetical protein